MLCKKSQQATTSTYPQNPTIFNVHGTEIRPSYLCLSQTSTVLSPLRKLFCNIAFEHLGKENGTVGCIFMESHVCLYPVANRKCSGIQIALSNGIKPYACFCYTTRFEIPPGFWAWGFFPPQVVCRDIHGLPEVSCQKLTLLFMSESCCCINKEAAFACSKPSLPRIWCIIGTTRLLEHCLDNHFHYQSQIVVTYFSLKCSAPALPELTQLTELSRPKQKYSQQCCALSPTVDVTRSWNWDRVVKCASF